MTSGMAEPGMVYPPVFVVDSQARYLPPPPERRPSRKGQTLLYVLVMLVICGLAVEACFIYRLYAVESVTDTATAEKSSQDESDINKPFNSRAEVKPLKPSAHLAGSVDRTTDSRLVMWITSGGDSFTHEMDYIDGKLYVRKEGFYFIYSKVYFSEQSRMLFTHSVMRSSPRLPGTDTTVMRSRRFFTRNDRTGSTDGTGDMLNSYLGGVYLLHEGDAIFVQVNHTKLLRQLPADNFFGAYMM